MRLKTQGINALKLNNITYNSLLLLSTKFMNKLFADIIYLSKKLDLKTIEIVWY